MQAVRREGEGNTAAMSLNSSPDFLLSQLINPATRENALAELSRYRETVPDLAILLWSTPGKN